MFRKIIFAAAIALVAPAWAVNYTLECNTVEKLATQQKDGKFLDSGDFPRQLLIEFVGNGRAITRMVNDPSTKPFVSRVTVTESAYIFHDNPEMQDADSGHIATALTSSTTIDRSTGRYESHATFSDMGTVTTNSVSGTCHPVKVTPKM
jgi:hypothetical protein